MGLNGSVLVHEVLDLPHGPFGRMPTLQIPGKPPGIGAITGIIQHLAHGF